MNNLAKLSIASALMLSAAFGVATAQQADDAQLAPGIEQVDGDNMGHRGGRHGEGRGKHGGRGGKHGMQMIDANNDGVVGADEAASMAEFAFHRMDDNRDGKLTEAEFIAGPRGHKGWFNWNSDEKAAVEKVRKDKFASLDTNKDAGLDKARILRRRTSQIGRCRYR